MKLDRASEQISILEAETNEFFKINYKVVTEFENYTVQKGSIWLDGTVLPDIYLYENTLHMLQQAPTNEWSLRSGEIIHNLRGSLDHAVYELAQIGSGQQVPPGEQQLQFPIFENLDKYKARENQYLKSVNQLSKNFIELVQPFNNPNSLFLKFQQLSNWDKHRFLQFSVVFLDEYSFRNPERVNNPSIVVTLGNRGLSGERNVTEVRDGMKLSPISIHDPEGDHIEDYLIDIKFETIFANGLSANESVIEILKGIECEVRSVQEGLKTLIS